MFKVSAKPRESAISRAIS